MAWQTNVLVVANQTAGSDELLDSLKRRAERDSAKFTLLMPCGPGHRADTRRRLEEAVERMRAAGLEAEGQLGEDANPLYAISEVWDAKAYDEIVISTFERGISRWLNNNLLQRVSRLTNAPVEHVVSASTSPPLHTTQPRPLSGVKDASDFVAHFFGSKSDEGDEPRTAERQA